MIAADGEAKYKDLQLSNMGVVRGHLLID
jgi:hypothetical protein